jgi:DNA-binding IclR family transcriptional regulator
MARASKYEASKVEVLGLIREAHARHSKPPTVRDLAAQSGVGVATMHSYLQKLAEEGLVDWDRNRHRSLRLTREGIQQLSSPDA